MSVSSPEAPPLSALPGLVLVLDAQGRVEAWSAGCAQVSGLSLEAVRGRPLWELLYARADVERLRTLFERPRTKDFPVSLEAAWKGPDGVEGPWVGLDLGVLEAEGGRPRWLAGTGLDLTRHHLAEQERLALLARLEEQRQRMEAVLRRLPTGVIIRDTNGRVSDYNDQAELLLGARVSSTLRDLEQVASVSTQMDGTPFRTDSLPMLRLLRDDEPVRHERVRYRRPDGRELILDVSTEAVRDEEGRAVAGVIVFADHTEQVRAEQALREREEAIRELHTLMSTRTGELGARLAGLLAAGCRRFGLPRGAVLRIEGSYQEVVAEHGPPVSTSPGQEARLEASVRVADRAYGVLGFRGPPPPGRRFTDTDRDLLSLMALWLGGELERERARHEQRLLAAAGALFSTSQDENETLHAVARLIVQSVAHACIIDLADGEGPPERRVLTHRDPDRTSLVETLRGWPVDRSRPYLAQRALEAGQPLLVADLPAAELVRFSRSPEHLRLLTELNPRSLMVLPLMARGRRLGAMAFISSRPYTYDEDSLEFGRELSQRAALAMDHARLSRQVQGMVGKETA